MKIPAQRPVIQSSARRDTMIAIAVGIGVLAIVIIGVAALMSQQGKPSANQLSGVIVAKHDLQQKEREISYGRKGLKARETDSGLVFEVRVEAENRTYEVPVSKGLYDARKVGDRQSFIRPKSEQ